MEKSIGQHWHCSKVLLNHEESRSCRSWGQQNMLPHSACNTARNYKYDKLHVFLEFRNTNGHVLLKNRYFLVYNGNIFAVTPLPLKDLSLCYLPMQLVLYKPLGDYRNSQWFRCQCNHLCTMYRKHQMLKFDKSSAPELHS